MILQGFARTYVPAARTLEKVARFQTVILGKTQSGSP